MPATLALGTGRLYGSAVRRAVRDTLCIARVLSPRLESVILLGGTYLGPLRKGLSGRVDDGRPAEAVSTV